MTRHNCEEWIAEGWGCANCNATAGAVRHYWNDPVREERDELRKDKERLDWLSMNLPFDVWHDIDIHDLAAERIHSDDEPEMYAAYAIAIRKMIDTIRGAK